MCVFKWKSVSIDKTALCILSVNSYIPRLRRQDKNAGRRIRIVSLQKRYSVKPVQARDKDVMYYEGHRRNSDSIVRIAVRRS